MFKKALSIFVVALLASPLFADVELSTSINDVFWKGTNELAGSIKMTVTADDFRTASTTEPIFIRVTLDHEAKLAKTLVTDKDNAIDLAMILNSTSASATLVADPTAVSIVRWVEGEESLWIRVQQSSSDWIDNFGPTIPDDNDNVSWQIGISARTSVEDIAVVDAFTTANGQQPKTNLFGNSRSGTALSTLICVDLSDEGLGSDGVPNTGFESILQYDIIAFDESAENADGSYGIGVDKGVNFTNDFRIARGKNRECTVTIGDKGGFASEDLCVPQAFGNDTIQGFLWASNSITFIINCDRGAEFLLTDLIRGSYIHFDTGNRGTYGFHSSRPPSFEDMSYSTTLTDDFDSHGEDLYSEATIVYEGGTVATVNRAITANVDLRYHYEDGPVTLDLDYSIVLVNHDGAQDDAPFDNEGQEKKCPPSEFEIATGTWNFGEFTECAGKPVVLFFPYMPKLKGDALFWSGLSIVNQGTVDLENMDVHIYDEDGNLFTAEFPALAERNQYTWLLIDDPEAGNTGFYGMGAHEDMVIVPAPDSDAVAAESFGETRMSMFVVGSFTANFDEEVDAGDLDGYLLIGKGGDIDGSYLPRHTDNDDSALATQNQDLPIHRSKKGIQGKVVNKLGDTRPATFTYKNGVLQIR